MGVSVTSKEFEFNDEFFLKPEIEAKGASTFQRTWFAIHNPNISKAFNDIDILAKQQKRKFQNFGFWAVGFAVLALSLAAIESAFILPAVDAHQLPKGVSTAVALAAALAGIVSCSVGLLGMGISGRKRQWLETRLICERIRQWRWQYFCANIPKIIAASGNQQKVEEYQATWTEDFNRFLAELRTTVADHLKSALVPSRSADVAMWLDDGFGHSVKSLDLGGLSASSPEKETMGELLAAYANIRIGAQSRYAAYLVTPDGPFRTHPGAQRRTLHRAGTWIVIAILALHLAVVAGILLGSPELKSKLVHVTAIVFAFCALGLRAVEDGLRPKEHLGRLKGYLAEITSIGDTYDPLRGDYRERAAMVALEKAAYKEMLDFLQNADKAKYVM
mgnify:CR=1 FL=1